MLELINTGSTRNFVLQKEIGLVVAATDSKAFPKEFAIADFTGDGKLDVVITTINILEDKATPIRLLVGDGFGGFRDSTETLFGSNIPGVVFARQLLVADFNRDGRSDLYVADHGYDRPPFPGFQNSLVLSSGASGVENATGRLPAASDFTHSASVADIDRDGDLDIFVGNLSANPYFLINDGAGGFSRSNDRLTTTLYADGKSPSTVLLFDADGDGDPDLLLGATDRLGATVILRNDGSGRFTSTLTSAPGLTGYSEYEMMDATAVDLNGDGRLDIVASYELNRYVDGRLQILINRPDGAFVDETTNRVADPLNPIWIRRAQVVDLNGDGAPDIFLAADTNQPVYLNTGAGTFVRMPVGFVPGNYFDNTQVADLNADGRMDLFAVRNPQTVSVRLGRDPGLQQTGDDQANGFMGDDDHETFSGLGGDDVIFAGRGEDTATGGTGNDTIVGGEGVSYLRGDEGNDSLIGGGAFDDINGNMGNDTVSTGAGDDYCVGGKDNDSLDGGAGYDLVYGNLGDDTCEGGEGNDIVRGGQGNDLVRGGQGNDYVSGDRGDDTMTGGSGADTFHSFGEAGIDRVTDFNLAEGDRVLLDPGTTYTLTQSGADTVVSMNGGGQLILVGVSMSSLTGSWITVG